MSGDFATADAGQLQASDAFMRDIPAMIVREGVADRSEAVMEANLFDVDQKYGDVMPLDICLAYLSELKTAAAR